MKINVGILFLMCSFTVLSQRNTIISVAIEEQGIGGGGGSETPSPYKYGAGSGTTGGEGGSVYRVTNLNNSGSGSFRNAFDGGTDAMTIIFDVAGTIELTSDLAIYDDNFTIAGQSAPSPGIAIVGEHVSFNNVDNAIIRYIRFRPEWKTADMDTKDAVTFNRCTNIILDHLSVSWATDEAITFVGGSSPFSNNISVLNCMMSHGKTASILGDTNYALAEGGGENFTYARNFIAHISHRFPLYDSANRLDDINNVIFDWRNMTVVLQTQPAKVNYINNFHRFGNQPTSNLLYNYRTGRATSNSGHRIYSSGNIFEGVITEGGATNGGTKDIWQWWGGSLSGEYTVPISPQSNYYMTVLNYSGNYNALYTSTMHSLLGADIPILTATQARDQIPGQAGAIKTISGNGTVTIARDLLESRILSRYNSDTGLSYTGSGYNWGSTTDHSDYMATYSTTPTGTHPAGYDTDNDGMPDVWETARFGSLGASNGTTDTDGSGLVDLYDYLNLVDVQ